MPGRLTGGFPRMGAGAFSALNHAIGAGSHKRQKFQPINKGWIDKQKLAGYIIKMNS